MPSLNDPRLDVLVSLGKEVRDGLLLLLLFLTRIRIFMHTHPKVNVHHLFLVLMSRWPRHRQRLTLRSALTLYRGPRLLRHVRIRH